MKCVHKFAPVQCYDIVRPLDHHPSGMTGESNVVLKNDTFLLNSLTKQNIKVKIIAYLCLLTKVSKR